MDQGGAGCVPEQRWTLLLQHRPAFMRYQQIMHGIGMFLFVLLPCCLRITLTASAIVEIRRAVAGYTFSIALA
jgi:hypothetical protein